MGYKGTQKLHQLVIANSKHGVLDVVNCSELVPLRKKGVRTQPANSRGVQLISTILKVIVLLISVPLIAAPEG